MTISATTDLRKAAHTSWDVVVVGAGPAGAIAARQLSLQGHHALLVDRKAFPRDKICGACVNGRAVAALAQLGLDRILARLSAVALRQFHVQSDGQQVIVPLPGGVAVRRAALDAALVQAAARAGADFLPETSAQLCDVSRGGYSRDVRLVQHGNQVATVSANVVLLADGLGNSSLQRHSELRSSVAPASRIGLGAIVTNCPEGYEPGTIFMAIAKWGYVGLVRVEDGALNIAAALDPAFVRRCHHPSETIATILEKSGLPAIASLESANWSGTVPLTRRTWRPAARRVLVLGDAAGYVEPFTGEGILWAISSGAAAASLVSRRLATWAAGAEQEWVCRHRRLVLNRQRWCRRLAWLLRHPLAVGGTLRAVSLCPWLVRPIMQRLNEPPADQLREPDASFESIPPIVDSFRRGADSELAAREQFVEDRKHDPTCTWDELTESTA